MLRICTSCERESQNMKMHIQMNQEEQYLVVLDCMRFPLLGTKDAAVTLRTTIWTPYGRPIDPLSTPYGPPIDPRYTVSE